MISAVFKKNIFQIFLPEYIHAEYIDAKYIKSYVFFNIFASDISNIKNIAKNVFFF